MKENIAKIIDSLKGFWNKIKEQLKKIDIINKLVAIMRANRLVLSIIFFCAVILTLILIATLGWGEFVVPVCVLMILEVTMSVLLHRTEIWIHGVLLLLHIIVGFIIGRVPMTLLCVIAYVTTTLTQQLALKRAVENAKVETETVAEPVKEEIKSSSKKKKK